MRMIDPMLATSTTFGKLCFDGGPLFVQPN
jgi:hypothetical protein